MCVFCCIQVNTSRCSLSHFQKQLNEVFRHFPEKLICISAVDAFPVAVQPSGETAAAEMVHGSQRS